MKQKTETRFFEVKKLPDENFSHYCQLKYNFNPLHPDIPGEEMKMGEFMVAESPISSEDHRLTEFIEDFITQGVIKEIEEYEFYSDIRRVKWHVSLSEWK